MKTSIKFAVIVSVVISANIYYSFALPTLSTVEENAESLSIATMSSKTGIPVVRYEQKGETATTIVIDEITTCIPGTKQTCNAGTTTIYQLKPNL